MQSMDRLYETLTRALEKATNESLTSSSLDNIFKLVGTLYKLEKMGMSEGEYSLDGDSSYARGRGRNANRDSMGRYSRDGMSNESGYSRDYSNDYSRDYSNRGSYGRGSYDGYSNHNEEEIKQKMRMLMSETQDPNVKQRLQQWLDEMEHKR